MRTVVTHIPFHVPSPDKSEQRLTPVSWHPLLDRKGLLCGWAGCSGDICFPAGRIPGWQPGPAQGGAGQRVASVQELFQKWCHVSQKKMGGGWWWEKNRISASPTHTHTHTHQMQSSGDMAYNSNPSAWNHYNTNNTFSCWGLAKKHTFFSPQFNNLRLVVVFYTTVICYFKLNKNACSRFCIHPAPWTAVLYCTWTLSFAPSPATRRAGRPRALTTLTQTPTASFACCMSKGGRTSPRTRYGEQAIKGPVKD